MHFRRRHRRNWGAAGRGRSSDYRYPQIEKGERKRSRAGVRRWVERAVASLLEWRRGD